jgi:hypothetical protein
MIKKTLCILILLTTVAAVVFAALNRPNSKSVLLQYLQHKQSKTVEQTTDSSVCDTIPCDTTTVRA